MNTGEIAVIAWIIIGGFVMAYKHGKPKDGEYSFWWYVLSSTIWIALLYWAGLFH
jgi:hypothetical protein